MPRYRLGRRASTLSNPVVVARPFYETPAVVEAVEAEEPSYRDLQAEAKEAGIPANQSAEDLKSALGKSDE